MPFGRKGQTSELYIVPQPADKQPMPSTQSDDLHEFTCLPVQKGIDQPIQIIREIWTAKSLDLQVLNIDDNSRTGRTVMKVVELKQGDPDPALFAAPAGYTIQDPKPAQ